MRLLMIVALGLGSGPAAAAEDPIDPPSATICGDGIVDATEACDDGSTGGGSTGGDGPADGDGCSATCTIELPPPPPPICGNGIVELGEQCDDGNDNNIDGCSNSCLVQT